MKAKDVVVTDFSQMPIPDYACPIFPIFRSPEDYPGKFVCRMWLIRPETPIAAKGVRHTNVVAIGNTLEEVRKALPAGTNCIPRFGEDVPCLVETWI